MLPMLASAESQVANIRVRSQGTLGGNLCFNDPHSDPATVLLVHDATCPHRGSEWKQANPAATISCSECTRPRWSPTSCSCPSMFRGYRAEFGSSYLRIHRLQRPTLGVAAVVSLRDGALADVRLAVGCVGPKAVRLTELEAKFGR